VSSLGQKYNPQGEIMKHTPYDTGKVKIGLLYTPPTPIPTPEETWVQGILLGDRQGLSEETTTAIGAFVALIVITIVMLLTGGTSNA
jgi:hypothetical protein